MLIDDDRLLPADPASRPVARRLYEGVKDLPILSPHGHTDPRWYAEDAPFPDPATLFRSLEHSAVSHLRRPHWAEGWRAINSQIGGAAK